MLNKFINWFMNTNPDKVFRVFFKIWLVWAILIALFGVGVVSAAIHFVLKYW